MRWLYILLVATCRRKRFECGLMPSNVLTRNGLSPRTPFSFLRFERTVCGFGKQVFVLTDCFCRKFPAGRGFLIKGLLLMICFLLLDSFLRSSPCYFVAAAAATAAVEILFFVFKVVLYPTIWYSKAGSVSPISVIETIMLDLSIYLLPSGW